MPMRRLTRNDDGAVAVIVAICTIMLFGFGALAVDLGNGFARTSMAQKDADFSALAGASQLSAGNSAVISEACDYLLRNLPQSDNGSTYSSCDSSTLTKLTNGDQSDGEISISPDGTTVTVWTPDSQVSFGLANAIGFNSTKVRRTATAGIFSPGTIMPLAIPAGCAFNAHGFVTLKTDSKDGNCSDSTGDFGFLNILRKDNSGTWTNKPAPTILELNLRYGVDHALAALSSNLPIDPPTSCLPDGTAYAGGGTYHWDTPSNAAAGVAVNCVDVESGSKSSIITPPFIENTSQCDGRLENAPASALTRGFTFPDGHTCMLDGRRLSDYLKGSAKISQATAPGATGVLDASIVESPNFFVVPVLNYVVRPSHTGNSMWQISDFRGFYIDCLGSSCSPFTTSGKSSNITSLSGYAFDLSAIDGPYASKFTGPRCNCSNGVVLLTN